MVGLYIRYFFLIKGSSLNLIENVAKVFKGMIQVAKLNEDSNEQTLRLFQDDRDKPAIFKGDIEVDSIVSFVLENLDQVINARS